MATLNEKPVRLLMHDMAASIGKPNQNAFIERFNRTFREEILDQHLFLRLDDVREAAWWWMIEYNEQRPHDSLGELTPAEYRQRAECSSFELPA